jgi:hypothetical protein
VALNDGDKEFWSGTSLNDLFAVPQNARTPASGRILPAACASTKKLRERRITDAGTPAGRRTPLMQTVPARSRRH